MELSTATTQIVGFAVNPRSDAYPLVPTLIEADVTFGGSQVLTCPEPSRAELRLWWPAWARELLPSLRDPARLRVIAGGTPAYVFDGAIDGIRRKYREPNPGEVQRQPKIEPLPLYTADAFSLQVWKAGTFVSETVEPVTYGGVLAPTLTTGTGIVHHVIPMPPPPAGSLLWAGEAMPPASMQDQADLSFWHWRVNGRLTPVAAGMFMMPAGAVTDFALVSREFAAGTADVPWVTQPRRFTVTHPGIKPEGEYVTVTASDPLSDAGRLRVGDVPWPVESAADRWSRIAARVRAKR